MCGCWTLERSRHEQGTEVSSLKKFTQMGILEKTLVMEHRMITSTTRRIDCLVEMLQELHKAQPFLCDVDGREGWFDALAQLVRALPSYEQRMAWVVMIANDLCALVPGSTLPSMAAYVQARLGLTPFPPI